jgi:two-component SAPR family response regulator
MKVAKLINKNGQNIQNPKTFIGSVSYDSLSGEAYAWAEDGKTLLAKNDLPAGLQVYR